MSDGLRDSERPFCGECSRNDCDNSCPDYNLKKLPEKWAFEKRPNLKWADPKTNNGLALEVRQIAGIYYRAELLIEDENPNVTKRSWLCGFWYHSEKEEEAIRKVEEMALFSHLVMRQ